jgi:hypothetical protein
MTRVSINTNTPALSDKAIGGAISALLGSFETENIQAYNAVSNTQEAQKAVEALRKGDINRFHFAMGKMYPAEKVIDGLLANEFPNPMAGTNANDLRFLFKHGKFVDYHVRRLIDTYEGDFGGAADKSRTLLRAILRHLKTGEEIVFNFDQEYTFHLPKFVFTEHHTTLQFFKSLQNLYYGNSDAYLHALLAVRKTAEERRSQYDANKDTAPDTSSPSMEKP